MDVCPACKAVWFDAGELERVVAENRKQFVATFPAAQPSMMSAPALLLDALGFILKTIGAILLEVW